MATKSRTLTDKVLEYQQTNDPYLVEEILSETKNLVRSVASKIRKPSDAWYSDMLQEGRLAVYQAIEDFDPAKGGKSFTTHAYPRIRGYILHFLRDSSKTIDIPAWVQERSIRLKRVTKKLIVSLKRMPMDHEIAEAMGMSVKEYYEFIDSPEHKGNKVVELDNATNLRAVSAASYNPFDKSTEAMDLWEEAVDMRKAENGVREFMHHFSLTRDRAKRLCAEIDKYLLAAA